MSTIEKLSKEFEALTLQEKVDFLNRITPSSEGEWVKTNGNINFSLYEAEILTEEGEEALQEGFKQYFYSNGYYIPGQALIAERG